MTVSPVSDPNPVKDSNLRSIVGLEPREAFECFLDFCAAPCAGNKVEPMLAILRRYAEANGFEQAQDQANNMAIYAPGRGRGAGLEPVVVQFHTDMVISPKNHDFNAQPMRIIREQRTIKGIEYDVLSTGGTTTLGADNRAAGALALVLAADPSITDRPPIIILATSAEEEGLVGARALDAALLRGSKMLINIDNENFGEFLNRCAGQATFSVDLALRRESIPEGSVPVLIDFKGFPGGHSGVNIHETRGNALKDLIIEFSNYMRDRQDSSIRLASITGGEARNAIPPMASLLVWASKDDANALAAHFNSHDLKVRIGAGISAETKAESGEPIVQARIEDSALLIGHLHGPIEKAQAKAVLEFLGGVPHGVAEWEEGGMASGRPALSNNFAMIESASGSLRLTCMARHVDGGVAQEYLSSTLAQLAAATYIDGVITCTGQSSGWIGGSDYPLLNIAKSVFQQVIGNAPSVTSIHAGVEPGEFDKLVPGLQQISWGPNIFGAHTVHECLDINSFSESYKYLKALLSELAK